MSVQDQYTRAIRQATETWAGVTQSAKDSMQSAFAQAAGTYASIDPHVAIDQTFDFWEKSLAAQRGIAMQLAGVTVAAADGIRDHAESVATVVREQSESAAEAIREQAETAQQALDEKVTRRYADLTKAQLQDELAGRDLPKAGLVEELRERLIEDDKR